MICLPRRELKRSRRQSWLCFGGGSDSAEWWGGGSDSQHAISIDDEENDSNQYSSSQPVLRVGHSEPTVGTNAKFPESSTPCLGLLKRKCSRSYARKQIGRNHLARRELKRSRRQSWLCFGGGSDSAEWSGGGGGAGRSDSQHAISIPDEQNDINQYPSSQPVLRVGHSESDDIQHSATSPGIEESSHIDIQDDNDIHGHHEAQPRRNDDKNQKGAVAVVAAVLFMVSSLSAWGVRYSYCTCYVNGVLVYGTPIMSPDESISYCSCNGDQQPPQTLTTPIKNPPSPGKKNPPIPSPSENQPPSIIQLPPLPFLNSGAQTCLQELVNANVCIVVNNLKDLIRIALQQFESSILAK
ncbi:hypothetical protein LWI29_002044 [Acer saccharum]|uniref:Uncharacterized protein n=1 Tax=Acer saccharum TaxID=4024 RepID=A0AA39RU80_ACESA|nr:hypothetical protein LWI29_002044 [Acer saccharum]